MESQLKNIWIFNRNEVEGVCTYAHMMAIKFNFCLFSIELEWISSVLNALEVPLWVNLINFFLIDVNFEIRVLQRCQTTQLVSVFMFNPLKLYHFHTLLPYQIFDSKCHIRRFNCLFHIKTGNINVRTQEAIKLIICVSYESNIGFLFPLFGAC